MLVTAPLCEPIVKIEVHRDVAEQMTVVSAHRLLSF
jgi:hypothetical protein